MLARQKLGNSTWMHGRTFFQPQSLQPKSGSKYQLTFGTKEERIETQMG